MQIWWPAYREEKGVKVTYIQMREGSVLYEHWEIIPPEHVMYKRILYETSLYLHSKILLIIKFNDESETSWSKLMQTCENGDFFEAQYVTKSSHKRNFNVQQI